ncbi:hypothetical protein ACOBQB_10435 [Streptomyces sp. G5(2025)]|uniref:hypothetical protein n=1 Tax=Streptomyces sp. G5(2025) TaxID=3406628 RepID=UPI003C188712
MTAATNKAEAFTPEGSGHHDDGHRRPSPSAASGLTTVPAQRTARREYENHVSALGNGI